MSNFGNYLVVQFFVYSLILNIIKQNYEGVIELEYIVEKCYDTLKKYCLVKTRSKTASEDITQECFKILYEKRTTEEVLNPEHFLFKTAKNLCYKYFSSSNKIQSLEDLNIELKDDFNEDKIITNYEIEKYKEKILSLLSPVEQEVIELYYTSKISAKEISEKINKSEWAVYKIKKNAEKKIKINIINFFQK